MERLVGTISMGVRAPIIREGDDIAEIVIDSVIKASESIKNPIKDQDVIAVTESVVARAQGNYASVDDVATDIHNKFGNQPVGVIFPILSRNRFAICLRGIAKGAAMGAKKVVLMLSYPSDEVGNHLVSFDDLDKAGLNPYSDVLTEKKYRELFGIRRHPFTGVDYVEYYKGLVEECGCECEIILANDARAILPYTKAVLACDIHTRERSKRLLKEAGAEIVYGMDDILSKPISGGYNSKYGLLGSNKATEDTLKLFPENCQEVVDAIQQGIYERTGKHVEAMVYGDGAFKDPVGKIWELADPVVSPAYTSGLEGQPSELKMKYLADNDFKDLSGEELKKAIAEEIKKKDAKLAAQKKDTTQSALKGQMVSEGTTPRRLTDLIGSLSDLTSGSGDKGTPIIWIQGYFDNYTK